VPWGATWRIAHRSSSPSRHSPCIEQPADDRVALAVEALVHVADCLIATATQSVALSELGLLAQAAGDGFDQQLAVGLEELGMIDVWEVVERDAIPEIEAGK
jgi:hypothetical protein